jgi:hypothetical protein
MRRIVLALLLLSAVAALPSVPADPQSESVAAAVRRMVTPERLDQHSRRIVEHERLSGSAGENAAIDYIVSTLRADGIPVTIDTIRAYTSDPVTARVELLRADGGVELAPPKSITVAFSGTVLGLEAPLVDVGDARSLPALDAATGAMLGFAPIGATPVRDVEPTPGTNSTSAGAPAAPALTHAQLETRLRGAIALVTGTPGPEDAWKLQQLGALGAVFVNPAERLNELTIATVWGTPSMRDVHRIPRLAIAEVMRSDGDAIRRLLADGTPRRVRMSAETRQGWKTLRLAVARIPAGLNPSPNAPYVLFGGHIDAWYHGGTDEGASNAAMLEIARGFHAQRAKLRRGIVVAWWPGHSNGRYAGSAWFADHRFTELRDRAIAYVNVDGIGQKGAATFTANTTASLAGLASDVVRTRTGVRDLRVGRPGRDSDQSFNGIGLPQLQLNDNRRAEDGGYWWWHTPDDTYDKIDVAVLKRDTDLYIDALAALMVSPVPPIDVVAEVAALGTLIEQRQAASAGALDLSAALERQRRLLALVRELQPRLASSRRGAEDPARVLVEVLRPIHRVLYTLGGEYHPDPAVGFGPLPGLAGARSLASPLSDDDRRFTETSLVRERNRLVDGIDEAIGRARRH